MSLAGTRETSVGDQAQLPVFRLLLGVQVLATIVFGLVPLIVPSLFAEVTGYSGDDELIYRLAGAATTGYFVAALAALAGRWSWADLRIAMVATATFTGAAALGCLLAFVGGDGHWVVLLVLAAAAAFILAAGYWLRRDEGPETPVGSPIDATGRAILALASLSAAVFGLLGLLAPAQFASLFGLAGTDAWIYRMAGAATLGYAVAGVLEIRAAGHRRIAVQNFAAIAFNATSAAVCWMSVAVGGGGLAAPVIAVAATLFTVLLIRTGRQGVANG